MSDFAIRKQPWFPNYGYSIVTARRSSLFYHLCTWISDTVEAEILAARNDQGAYGEEVQLSAAKKLLLAIEAVHSKPDCATCKRPVNLNAFEYWDPDILELTNRKTCLEIVDKVLGKYDFTSTEARQIIGQLAAQWSEV